MKESVYQAQLIKKLNVMFKGCVILKNDPMYIQGIPDLLILHNNRWAMLEVKHSTKAHVQPNQKYWIEHLDQMCYASFISPETEDEVLNELQHALGSFG